MNVKSVEKQEKSTVELVIEIGKEEFEAAVEKVYKKQRGKISVPGFRKGKAPRKIIEGMYGSGVFYEDAINDLYPEAYAQAIEQEKLDAVAWPKVEIVDVGKEGLTFKALVTVRPEVKLGEYKGIEIIEGHLMPDHVHVLLAIPPKYSVASVMGYLKGKSSLMIFDRHANLKYKFGNRKFWAEGYYVSTVGLNEATIAKYIREQESHDIALDKLSVKEYEDPFKRR